MKFYFYRIKVTTINIQEVCIDFNKLEKQTTPQYIKIFIKFILGVYSRALYGNCWCRFKNNRLKISQKHIFDLWSREKVSIVSETLSGASWWSGRWRESNFVGALQRRFGVFRAWDDWKSPKFSSKYNTYIRFNKGLSMD